MNPLISMMASSANSNNPVMGMLSKYSEFKRNWTPESAQQKINDMLRSGQINSQQYEQARQMAESLRGIVK